MKKLKSIGIIGVFSFFVILFMACQESDLMKANVTDSETCTIRLKSGDMGETLTNLNILIQSMIDDGTLNKGNGNALMVKINAVLNSLDRENMNAASGQLNAYINQIGDFLEEGIISIEQGQNLLACGFIDGRDGQVYPMVIMGSEIWMGKNLAYLPMVHELGNISDTEPRFYVYGYNGINVNEAKATENYHEFGVLYNWEAAMYAAPEGWHLPSDMEWQIMEKGLGMVESEMSAIGWRGDVEEVGFKLKSAQGWNDGNGDNSSGFNALPAGYMSATTLEFRQLGQAARFYTSTMEGSDACYRFLRDIQLGITRNFRPPGWASSVRCIKDE